MGPSEVYRLVANDVASDFALCIEEIQLHVDEPANPERQHYLVQVDADEDPEPAKVGDDVHMVGCEVESTAVPTGGAQPQSVTQFLSLPLVTTTGRIHQSQVHVDFSKSHVLTSDEYIRIVEQKRERKDAVERAKAAKKAQREVDMKKREDEKVREADKRRQREEERAAKKLFDAQWRPAAISTYGQCL
jgi:hypothetical protein